MSNIIVIYFCVLVTYLSERTYPVIDIKPISSVLLSTCNSQFTLGIVRAALRLPPEFPC